MNQFVPEQGFVTNSPLNPGLSAADIETGRQVYLGKLKAALSAYLPEMAISLQQVRELAAILEALGPVRDAPNFIDAKMRARLDSYSAVGDPVHEAYVNAQRAVALAAASADAKANGMPRSHPRRRSE